MREASSEYNWDLDLGTIALGWRGGCIIRARSPTSNCRCL